MPIHFLPWTQAPFSKIIIRFFTMWYFLSYIIYFKYLSTFKAFALYCSFLGKCYLGSRLTIDPIFMMLKPRTFLITLYISIHAQFSTITETLFLKYQPHFKNCSWSSEIRFTVPFASLLCQFAKESWTKKVIRLKVREGNARIEAVILSHFFVIFCTLRYIILLGS